MVRDVLQAVLLLSLAGCARLVTPSDLRPAPHPLLDVAPGQHLGATATASPWRPRKSQPSPPPPLATAPSAAATRLPVQPAGRRPDAAPRATLLPAPARPARGARPANVTRPRAVGLPAPARPRGARPAPVQPARSARTVLVGIRRAGTAQPRRRPPRPRPLLPAPSRVRDPRVLEARRQVRRALGRMEGKRRLDRRPATDLALVRQALRGRGTRIDNVASVDDLWEVSVPQRRAAEAGDLVFFKPTPTVPKVCVVKRRLRGGVIEASCVTRGAVRTVRVSTGYPNLRRRNGRIINTFLRTRFPSDPPRSRYLAGQLLWQIRTPFR